VRARCSGRLRRAAGRRASAAPAAAGIRPWQCERGGCGASDGLRRRPGVGAGGQGAKTASGRRARGLYYRGSSTKSLHRNPATQPGRGPATCRHRVGDLAGWVNRCPVGWRGRTASWASWVPRSPGPARTIRRCSGCRCVAGHLPGPRSPAPARDVLRSAPACLTDAGDGRVSRLASGIAHDVPVVRPSSAPGSVRGQASARDRLRTCRHGGSSGRCGPGRSDVDGPGRRGWHTGGEWVIRVWSATRGVVGWPGTTV